MSKINLNSLSIVGAFIGTLNSLIVSNILNESLGESLVLGVVVIGTLLALIYRERRIDSLVSTLPYTELNGKRVYILSGPPGKVFVTPTLKPKILITDTTLDSFSGEELEGALEHETAHIRFKHNLITILSTFIAPSLGTAIMFFTLLYVETYIKINLSAINSVILIFTIAELVVVGLFVWIPASVILSNISEKEADWYAVNKVGKEVYLRVLNKTKEANEEEEEELIRRFTTGEIKNSFVRKVFLFRQRHPKLYNNYIFTSFITLNERINIIENGSYEPFSYKETIKLLLPIILLISTFTSVIFTYASALVFPKSSMIFSIIWNLVVLFSTMVFLIVLSSIIYFILRSLGIKEYLARTSILAYYVITSFILLFPGIIEGIIINLVGVTVAVLISSSEGKLGRAMIGWGSVYLINFLGVLTWLTLLRVV